MWKRKSKTPTPHLSEMVLELLRSIGANEESWKFIDLHLNETLEYDKVWRFVNFRQSLAIMCHGHVATKIRAQQVYVIEDNVCSGSVFVPLSSDENKVISDTLTRLFLDRRNKKNLDLEDKLSKESDKIRDILRNSH